MLTGAACVFTVADLPVALAYYRDALGFGVEYEYGSPISYACLCRDEVALHLSQARPGGRAAGQGGLAVFVSDVEAIHAELLGRGARVQGPPQSYDYGMRDFDVLDADGNRITFGQGTDPHD